MIHLVEIKRRYVVRPIREWSVDRRIWINPLLVS